MAHIYAVANQKGGVGKSTTCICLGAGITEHDNKVLLVDLDPQGGMTTSLGFDPDKFELTTYNSLIDEQSPLSRAIVQTKVKGLDLAPANLDLAGVEGELLGEIGWDRTLQTILHPLVKKYDFIMLDCPPSLGVLTTNALMASHKVIVPVQTEYLALRSLKQLNHVISKVKKKGNPELTVKILRTMHQAHTVHSQEAAGELQEIFAGHIYTTIIKRTIKFAEASVAGEPILSYLPKSPGAASYRELAKEVLNHG